MKIPAVERKHMLFRGAVLLLVVAGLLFPPVNAALHASGGDHGSEAKGWETTDTYRVMNFVVLVVVLFILLRKPISRGLEGRIQGIKSQLRELEEKKAEAEKELARYNEKISRLDSEAAKIVDEYIKQGNEAKTRIMAEAERAAVKLEAQARKNIEHEFEQAKLRIQEEILEKALSKAEEKLKANITPKDQDKLVDEYLEKVVVL